MLRFFFFCTEKAILLKANMDTCDRRAESAVVHPSLGQEIT